MSLLAGMGRVHSAQRAHSALLDDEETRIRQLDALRSSDETAAFNKRNARAAQDAWARMPQDAEALPEPVDVPGLSLPREAAPAPTGPGGRARPRSASKASPDAKGNSNAIEVSEASNRLQALRRMDSQPARDRRALLQAPTALLDVVQAPAAGALNLFGSAVDAVQGVGNRVVNAVAGREIADPNPTSPKRSMTPFYDAYVRGPEAAQDTAVARLRALQAQGAGAEPTPVAPAATPAAPAAPVATTPKSISREQLTQAIYGQESNYGRDPRANVMNSSGVVGPMQVQTGTFEGLKRQGLIPQNYDIANRDHNMAAGQALISQLWNQFGGDPSKVAAAYYSGPKAIADDGTIRDLRDPLNPRAPTTRQYVAQVLGRVGVSAPANPSTAPAPPAGPAPDAGPQIAQGTLMAPEQFANFSRAADGQARMLTMRAQQLREVLRYTVDPGEQQKIVATIDGLNSQLYETQLVRAGAAAGMGDMRAMSQLAQAAGVSIAAGSDGSVIVVQPASDGRGQVRSVLAPAQAANYFYKLLSPRARAAEQAAQGERAKAAAKASGDIAVEQVKGQNAMATKAMELENQVAIEVAKLRSRGMEVQNVSRGEMGQPTLITLTNGSVFEFIPGQVVNGMQTENSLRQVPQQ